MNIPQVETPIATAEPRFTRDRPTDTKGETFTVPEDDGGEQAAATGAREEGSDAPPQDEVRAHVATPDVSAWMLAMLVPTAPTPKAPEPPAPPPDLTDPAATLAPVTTPAVQVAPQDPSTVTVPATPPPEAAAKTTEAPTLTESATASSKTAATPPAATPAATPPTKPAARADNVPTPPATPIVRDRTIAENASQQAVPTPRGTPPTARAKTPTATPEKAPAVATREPLAPPPPARVEAPPVVPSAPWVQPSAETTRSDNALTSVSAPTPALTPDGADPVRSRLQGALTTSMNQRALQGAAHGEVVLPDLGRVAVQARTEHGSVEIAVQASQAATSQALHARADQIAADVRAADIPVSRMSFESAGTWTPSHTDTAPREQRADTGGSRQERDASPAPRVQGANGVRPGRVRIVL